MMSIVDGIPLLVIPIIDYTHCGQYPPMNDNPYLQYRFYYQKHPLSTTSPQFQTKSTHPILPLFAVTTPIPKTVIHNSITPTTLSLLPPELLLHDNHKAIPSHAVPLEESPITLFKWHPLLIKLRAESLSPARHTRKTDSTVRKTWH